MCNLGFSIEQKGIEKSKAESMRNTVSLLREIGLSDTEIIGKMCKNFDSPLEVIERLVSESRTSKSNDALGYLDTLTR